MRWLVVLGVTVALAGCVKNVDGRWNAVGATFFGPGDEQPEITEVPQPAPRPSPLPSPASASSEGSISHPGSRIRLPNETDAARDRRFANFPRYDVEQFCGQRVARGQGGSALALCRQTEQDGYDALRYLWPTASTDTRAWCSMHDAPEYLYGRLSRCVIQFAEIDRLNRSRPFRAW